MKNTFRVLSFVALFGLALSIAVPASANGQWWFTKIKVENNNSASVENHVDSDADTGRNDTNATASGDSDDDAKYSAEAGVILSGKAEAGAETLNAVNSNITEITKCGGCEDVPEDNCEFEQENGDIEVEGNCGPTKIKVHNNNSASVTNWVDSDANTGRNNANAYATGNSDDDAEYTAVGGAIVTGDALSWASSANVVNSNLTLIER